MSLTKLRIQSRRLASVIALLMLAFFIFPAHPVSAQTVPPSLVCNPLPVEDPDKLNTCILLLSSSDGTFNPPLNPPDTANITTIDVVPGWNGSLAFNPVKNDWLVVSLHDGVPARLVSNDNKIKSDINYLAPLNAGEVFGSPRAVFAQDLNKYLVIWDQVTGMNSVRTMGRFVSPDNISLGSAFRIWDGLNWGQMSAATPLRYDSKNRRFVHTFENHTGGKFGTTLLTIDPDGRVDKTINVSVNDINAPITYIGGESAINPDKNEYCVAMYIFFTGDITLPDGTVTPRDGMAGLAVRSVNAATGELGPITEVAKKYSAGASNVVYNTENKEYFAFYENAPNVYGKILGPDCSGLNAKGPFLLQGNAGATTLAYNPKSNTYAVASHGGMGNVVTIIDSYGRNLFSDEIFTIPPRSHGLYWPLIEANIVDGTYAVTTGRDYGTTQMITQVGKGIYRCDPWPEDLAASEYCALVYGTIPPPGTREPGADPGNPTVLLTGGYHGVAAAYNSRDNTILAVGISKVNDDDGLWGSISSANLQTTIKAPFKIDQGPVDSYAGGSPKATYNPDDNQFMAVWEDSRTGDNRRHVHARLMDGAGNFVTRDFPVHTAGDAFLVDVDYDSTNRRYLVTMEMNRVFYRTVDTRGNVSPVIYAAPNTGSWQGHSSATYNSTTNEYWFTYATTLSGSDTSREDDRIMFSRVNASTGQMVGEPVQVSQTRIGRNAFSYPAIAYSPTDHKAVLYWMERDRDGYPTAVYGRSINDDGTMSSEYPVMDPATMAYSDFYGAPKLTYNQWTNSFFVSGEDGGGGTMQVEMLSDGTRVGEEQAISGPTTGLGGMFWPTNVSTKNGTITLASRNYSQVVGVARSSVMPPITPDPAIPNPPPGPVTPAETGTIGRIISQIYLWALGVSGLLAFIMVIFGGYLIMTAQGNATQVTKGKEFIYGAFIGLALLFGSYFLLSTVNPDLVDFNLDSLDNLNRLPRR